MAEQHHAAAGSEVDDFGDDVDFSDSAWDDDAADVAAAGGAVAGGAAAGGAAAQLQGQQQHLAYHGTMPSSKRPRVLRSRRWGWVRTQEFPQRKSWRAILLPPLVAVTGARRRCGR